MATTFPLLTVLVSHPDGSYIPVTYAPMAGCTPCTPMAGCSPYSTFTAANACLPTPLEEEPITRRAERGRPHNLFIFHLPAETDEGELGRLFCRFGPIVSIKIMREKDTKRSRGFGFVCFRNASDAATARSAMHNRKIGNKHILVDFQRLRQ